MKDTRLPSPQMIENMLKERINGEHFSISVQIVGRYGKSPKLDDYGEISRNCEENILMISIWAKKLGQYDDGGDYEMFTPWEYSYTYDPAWHEIKETNKKMKRKDKSLEEIIARECYNGFMANWIGMAKPPKLTIEDI